MNGSTAVFTQTPSPGDLEMAKNHPKLLNLVLGAWTNRVYLYNSNGLLTEKGLPLKDFLKLGTTK
jgi:hypothetical protein